MLLRQVLEQTRAGRPTPVLFNSSKVVLPIDEVSTMVQKDGFEVHFHTAHDHAGTRSFLHDSAGQLGHSYTHRLTAAAGTGARAS